MKLTPFAKIMIAVIVLGVAGFGYYVAGAGRYSGAEVTKGVSYSPPFVPLTIAVNTKGEISLTSDGKIPTPIGTFSVYANVSFPEKKTLTIVVADSKHVYDLRNTAFRVAVPNDRRGLSRVEYDGQGNIFVVIPDPVWQGISS